MKSAVYSLARRTVLQLLERGEASPSELTRVAGVSRMTVHRWCIEAGIDWEAARRERVAKAWTKAEKRQRGRKPGRKPTKKRQRQQADEAKVAWDQRHEGEELEAVEPGARGGGG